MSMGKRRFAGMTIDKWIEYLELEFPAVKNPQTDREGLLKTLKAFYELLKYADRIERVNYKMQKRKPREILRSYPDDSFPTNIPFRREDE